MTTTGPGEGAERELAPPDERPGDIPADTFSNRLILARVHAGWLTVKEAAERCSLNYGSWSNWERGARPRDLLDVAQKIADGLRIDYEWLLFGGPLLGARGRPAKRPGEDTVRYRNTPGVPTRRPVRPLEARLIARVHPEASILTSVPGRRATRVNPVQPAEAIYGR